VIDNFSNDETYIIACKYTDKVFQKGPERTTQKNYGVAHSNGEYVFFIDSDMVLSSYVIQQCVQELLAKNALG
jgi:glycosyltransferase involved in cell wall biosynthesis